MMISLISSLIRLIGVRKKTFCQLNMLTFPVPSTNSPVLNLTKTPGPKVNLLQHVNVSRFTFLSAFNLKTDLDFRCPPGCLRVARQMAVGGRPEEWGDVFWSHGNYRGLFFGSQTFNADAFCPNCLC